MITAVFVPQEWHRSDATVLLFHDDGTVTREATDRPLTAEEVETNCAERVRVPKPWKRTNHPPRATPGAAQ
jgi:hypothetical protein